MTAIVCVPTNKNMAILCLPFFMPALVCVPTNKHMAILCPPFFVFAFVCVPTNKNKGPPMSSKKKHNPQKKLKPAFRESGLSVYSTLTY